MEIKILGCEKADNCFANAKSYIYTLSSPVNDALWKNVILGQDEGEAGFQKAFLYAEYR